MKKLVGRTDIVDALSRLEHLTQDEVRMAAAQGLKATHEVDEKVQAINGKAQSIDIKVQAFGDIAHAVDKNVHAVGDKVQVVNDKVQGVDDKIDLVIDGVQQVADDIGDQKRLSPHNFTSCIKTAQSLSQAIRFDKNFEFGSLPQIRL